MGRRRPCVANPSSTRVYALTPENGSVHEIRADNLTFSRKLQVAATALEMRLSPAGDALYVLCRKPRQLVRLTLDPMQVAWTLPLRDDPADFDISPDGNSMAVSSGLLHYFRRSHEPAAPFRPLRTTGEIGLVRFQPFHGADRAPNPIRGN